MIDTHTHIYVDAFDEDRDEAVARALAAGVKAMMCPAIDSATHRRLFDLCAKYPGNCFPMIGLHPTHVNDNPEWEKEIAVIERYLANPPLDRFYAVGEIGLDLYWSRDWAKEQEEAFVIQLELSLEYGLPVVIHTRNAWAEVIEVLKRYRYRRLRGIMHAFSGTVDDYNSIKECGDFMFGIGGPVTYRNSSLPGVVEKIPLEDIVIETDSPYLPPVPFRGKRNESSYLPFICARIAEIKGMSPVEMDRITTANASRMFGLSISG